MPNIREYNAPLTLVPEPTDRAAATAREAGAIENRFGRQEGQALGGAIARVGSQIGEDVERHVTATRIGQLSVIHSARYADTLQQWNEAVNKADPNFAPAVMQQFKE